MSDVSPPADRPRVLVVCQLDGFANGLKPVQIERYLTRRGVDVEIVNTYHLSRRSWPHGARRHTLPSMAPDRLALYLVELAAALNRRSGWGLRHLSYPLAVADLVLRSRILERTIHLDDVGLVICETPYDAEFLLRAGSARTLYDCPTPWADELFYEGRLTERQHRRLRRRERDVFDGVDHLSFHWETYAAYAQRHYGIRRHNVMTMNFGCTPSPTRAVFDAEPRVVYLGSLSSHFIDLGLLSRLSALYGQIDVYGGPPPDAALGLNYRGYATPDVLDGYQAGLITCTRDELRRDGFSAKHLEYLAHGLPVLVPAWRRHLELLRGSVPYEEASFVEVVQGLADVTAWQRLSDEAYAESERRSWERALAPLDEIVDGLPSTRL